jgi:uncharacterized membrane protein YbhN (UPF0104 family)
VSADLANERSAVRRWLPGAASSLVLALLAAYLWRNRSFIVDTYALDPVVFVGVSALTLVGLALRAFANQLHFGGLGVRLTPLDWFRLITMTTFSNYLPLSAGLFAKALFLKRVHDVPYRRFAVGQTTLFVLVLATNGLTGLLILAVQFPEALFGVVGAGFAALTLSGALLFLPAAVQQKVTHEWFPLAEGVGPRANLAPVAAVQLGMLGASSLSLLLCFGMGDGDVGLMACVLFNAAAVITRLITIVPGALGIREFLIGGLAALVGFDLRDAVVAATLARAAEIVVVFALGGAFTWSFSRELDR